MKRVAERSKIDVATTKKKRAAMATTTVALLGTLVPPMLAWSPAAGRGLTATRFATHVSPHMSAASELDAILAADHKPSKGKLKKLLTKPAGTVSVVCDFSRTWKAIDSAKGEVNSRDFGDVEYMSWQFRIGGASVVAAELHNGKEDDRESSLADLQLLCREQATAKGEFPSPCPVYMAGDVREDLDIAEAKRSGCAGVFVDATIVGMEQVTARGGCMGPAFALAVYRCGGGCLARTCAHAVPPAGRDARKHRRPPWPGEHSRRRGRQRGRRRSGVHRGARGLPPGHHGGRDGPHGSHPRHEPAHG